MRSIFSKKIKQECCEILKLAWPTILAATLTVGISIQTITFSGYLGKSQLAAATLSMSVINVTGYAIGLGLTSGLDTLCTQAFGAKNYRMVGVVLQRGVFISAIGMILILSFWMLTGHVLVAVGLEHDLVR